MAENEIWEARRKRLEDQAIAVMLDLFQHLGCSAMALAIPDTTPRVYIVAGDGSYIIAEAKRIALDEAVSSNPPPTS
jgi:hypothetical protein